MTFDELHYQTEQRINALDTFTAQVKQLSYSIDGVEFISIRELVHIHCDGRVVVMLDGARARAARRGVRAAVMYEGRMHRAEIKKRRDGIVELVFMP